MRASALARLVWLRRRLSRMQAAEVPYRFQSLLRLLCQRAGWSDADRSRSLAADWRAGRAWVRVPPNPAKLDELLAEADDLAAGRLSVLGRRVPMARGLPDWNRDPVSGVPVPMRFGPAIDFRHLGRNLEIKYLWEVNRHLWWVRVAQAYAATGEPRYLEKLEELLDDWLTRCPYQRGPNWASPVEPGIRLINWSLVWHLIGGRDARLFDGPRGEDLRARWLDSVYKHIRFASDNYSFYSSADNHLIGEAAGVFVGAHTWDCWQDTRELRREAKELLEREIVKQFSSDGVNLEQAFCYQKFSVEFLLASALCGRANGDDFSDAFWARLESAIVFIAAMIDCAGNVPAYGDSDDGKVFSLGYGKTDCSYRAVVEIGGKLFSSPALTAKARAIGSDALDSPAAWFGMRDANSFETAGNGDELPQCFDQGGYLILGDRLHRAGEIRIVFDVGPLGYNRIAGHGHADALSLTLSWTGRQFLVDSGTYCYNADPELRRYFRGTASHNTVVVDGCDQSVYGSSFLWLRDVNSRVRSFSDDGETVSVVASHDGYRRLRDPVVHVRRVTFSRTRREVTIDDWFECKRRHAMTQHWHFASGCGVTLEATIASAQTDGLELRIELPDTMSEAELVTGRESPPMGWTSRRFYQREETSTLIVSGRAGNEEAFRTRMLLQGNAPTPS